MSEIIGVIALFICLLQENTAYHGDILPMDTEKTVIFRHKNKLKNKNSLHLIRNFTFQSKV